MEQINTNFIELFIFLLPGFVAASLFYLLTSHPKPNSFERTIQALIFTFIVQAIVWSIDKLFDGAIQERTFSVELSVSIAIIFGLIAAICVNYDILHRIFRYFKITKENSYSSEWYSAFSRRNGDYIVLHLYDGRSVFGWPTEWPSNPREGHFYLEEAEWVEEVTSEANSSKTTINNDVTALLIPVSDVQLVEFVQISIKKS